MDEKKIKKSAKNLYLPDWIKEILLNEGEIYGGEALITSVSIYYFNRLSKEDKIKAVKDYLSQDINLAYSDDDDCVASEKEQKYRQKSNAPTRSA